MTTAIITVIDRAKVELINTEHHLCERSYADALVHAMECGRMLAAVKADLPHGAFLPWINEHFEGTDRTAQRYMSLVEHRDEIEQANPTGLSDLSMTAALEQIAKPKPRPAPKPERKPTPNEVSDFMQGLSGRQQENASADLDDARERLRADVPAWTTQQERARDRALQALADATAYAIDSLGLSANAAAEELKLASKLAREASAILNNLAFEMGG